MLTVYPAIIHNDTDGKWLEFPDLTGCQTAGNSIEELMTNAEEVLGLYLATEVELRNPLPKPSKLEDIKWKGTKTYIATDISKYHRDTRAVKKMLSIPAWLAKESDQHNLSLSKVLQEALLIKLGLA
ncbi:MAG: type II toxin-antitoxin system HicB family antitoxin [Lachnospiraceae bacterium]|nr:type II toxin-antitoxin system HicB family antitoxin [Lachnospiraceae bacterium]